MQQPLQPDAHGALRAVQEDQREGDEKRWERDEQFEEARDEPRARERLEEQDGRERHAQHRGDARAREQHPQRRADHTARLRILEERGIGVQAQAVRPRETQQHEPHERIDHERPQHDHGQQQQMPLRQPLAAPHRRCMRGGHRGPTVAGGVDRVGHVGRTRGTRFRIEQGRHRLPRNAVTRARRVPVSCPRRAGPSRAPVRPATRPA